MAFYRLYCMPSPRERAKVSSSLVVLLGWVWHSHKGIRCIEWYRDYLMTIRRQLFCCAAYFCKRTPRGVILKPTNGLAWKGKMIKSCSVIGWRSTWGRRGGGSYSLDNCHASEELAPNRHQIISVPLYIPYSFMSVTLLQTAWLIQWCKFFRITKHLSFARKYIVSF